MQGTFGLDAKQLEVALGRFPKPPEITSTDDGSLTLKAGRLRTTLVPFHIDPPEFYIPEDDWQSVPDGLLEAFDKSLLFVTDENDTGGPWLKCINIHNSTVSALTTNRMVTIEIPGLNVPAPMTLTQGVVTYLAKLNEPPAAIALPKGHVWLKWTNGSWIRAQLSAFEWPEGVIDRMLSYSQDDANTLLDDEWCGAFKDAVALSEDGRIEITPDGIKANFNSMKVDLEFPTNAAQISKWNIKVLEPMFKVAERWNPDCEIAARFYGKNLRGVVSKLR